MGKLADLTQWNREKTNWSLTLDEVRHQLEGRPEAEVELYTKHIQDVLASYTRLTRRDYERLLDNAIAEALDR